MLPDAFQLRLRTALSSEFVVTVADGVDGDRGLSAFVESRSVDLIVVDPADRRLAGKVTPLSDLLGEYHWIPCVIYTSLSCAGIKPVVQLSKQGVRGLLLAGSDDVGVNIRNLVERLTADAVVDQLLVALQHPFSRLPAAVVRAIRGVFGAPHRYPSVEDLAVSAGVTVRHLRRLVTSVGLTSPLRIVVAARVLRAYQFFRFSDRETLDQSAGRLRIDPRSLSIQIREAMDVATVAGLRDLSPAEAVTRCVRTLYRPPTAFLRAIGDGAPSL